MGRAPVGRAFFLSLLPFFPLLAAPPGTAQTPAPLPLHDGFEFGAFAPWWSADANANRHTNKHVCKNGSLTHWHCGEWTQHPNP